MDTPTRRPAGLPAGGQFTERPRDEAEIALDSSGVGTGGRAPAEIFAATSSEPKRGQWTIYNPTIVETSSIDAYAITSRQEGGQPHLSVRARAAAKLLRSEHPGLPNFTELAVDESKVTVLAIASDGVVRALEGVVVLSGDSPILIRKGSTNHIWELSDLDVIAYEPGYHGQDVLAERFSAAVSRVPRTEKVNVDVIPLTSTSTKRYTADFVTAAFLVDGEPGQPDDDLAGCVFLATDRDGDTVNGFLWTPENTPQREPRTSMTVTELTAAGGRITTYQTKSLTLKKAASGALGPSRAQAYAALSAA